ncbi:Oxysterol-binding protein 2 [Echinococcus granulosus]|uniref:Oxysterol-binding protein 2 n=1 Tax=Echinococcus granulosus TaxID=6210 RepID=W6UYB7_ECHGR|nr:Oxysterol-binding protein 2 [Echinococcus granulosus]EUB63617.1 Oxysterol-binding protein 2 [Echinococcus granulosus]
MGADSALDLPSGWLYKWTNYLKGYRKRWFVLENGLFSYYRYMPTTTNFLLISNASAVSHTCMGTIDLTNVTISQKNSPTSFVLRESRGRSYHLKALNEQDKRRWLAALTSAKSKLLQSINDPESDSCSDDLNSYVPSRHSAGSNKLVQNNCASNWRSFRPFRRRHRQIISVASVSEGSAAVDSTAPEVTTACSMVNRSRVVTTAVGEVVPSDSESGPPMANGSRLVKSTVKGIACLQRLPTSSPSIPITYSPHRRRCTVNSGLTNELRVTREFQHHLNAVDSAFDNMVIQANHVLGFIGGMTNASEGDSDKSSVTVSLSALANLQSIMDELIKTCQKTMVAWTASTELFQRRLATEYDKSSRLERTVEQLAKQHRALETQFYSSYTSLTSNRTTSPLSSDLRGPSPAVFQRDAARRMHSFSSLDDVFYDAESTVSSPPSRVGRSSYDGGTSNDAMLLHPSFASLGSLRNVDESSGSDEDDLVTAAVEEGIFAVPGGRPAFNTTACTPPTTARMNRAGDRGAKDEDSNEGRDGVARSPEGSAVSPRHQRRTSIPPRPRISLNLWGVLKNCIGKELSRIPLPVNFNEPLSFLQRVTEDLTYSKCLDEAAQVANTDPVGRMAWIAAFSVSCYATTAVRMSKPFNPLLGETYECDRSDDFGWRSFAEQVSHHPPVVAHHCESIRYGWKFWQEFTVNSKFRGKYLSLIPKGGTHLLFKDGQHYTWSKVTITVHNIIVGRLWAEIHGETVIKNHNTNYTCRMHYEAHSYFSRDPGRQVSGFIYDPSGTLVYKLSGRWDNHVEGCAVSPDGTPKGSSTVLLVVEPPPPNSESMYNFNQLAIELNEPEQGVAPTDSRLRPDQRLMELGRWDEANTEKERLEVKQRRKRRAWDLFEAGEEPLDPECGPPYTPVWFSSTHDTYFDEDCHEFNGTYWVAKAKQDWSKCPNIF